MRQLLAYLLFCFLLPLGAQFPTAVAVRCQAVDNYDDYGLRPLFRQPEQRSCFDGRSNVTHNVFDMKAGDSASVGYSRNASQGKDVSVSRISRSRGASPLCSIGTDGYVYAAWMGENVLMFQRSADGGMNWLPQEKEVIAVKSNWSYTVDELPVHGSISMACDTSHGQYRDRLYLCWSDNKFSADDKDVFMTYSDDKGVSWTEPILVTYRANHKAQFMPHIEVDGVTGTVYIIYYDKQNYQEGPLVDLYLAKSTSGGTKFEYFKINTAGFSLSKKPLHNFTDLKVAPAVKINWSEDNEKGERQCYTLELNDSAYAAYHRSIAWPETFLQVAKTVTFSEKIKVPFQLLHGAAVTAVVTKPLDPAFEKVVFKEKKFGKGKNTIQLNTKELGLQKGNYTLFLYYNAMNTFTWIIEE